MFWQGLRPTKEDWDISNLLKQEIQAGSGDAIVNLRIKANSDWQWYVSQFIPMVPDHIAVRVDGEAVRIRADDTKYYSTNGAGVLAANDFQQSPLRWPPEGSGPGMATLWKLALVHCSF